MKKEKSIQRKSMQLREGKHGQRAKHAGAAYGTVLNRKVDKERRRLSPYLKSLRYSQNSHRRFFNFLWHVNSKSLNILK